MDFLMRLGRSTDFQGFPKNVTRIIQGTPKSVSSRMRLFLRGYIKSLIMISKDDIRSASVELLQIKGRLFGFLASLVRIHRLGVS